MNPGSLTCAYLLRLSVFCAAAGMVLRKRGRCKLFGGEVHAPECGAGIVVVNHGAFFFRHGIFRCMNEVLPRPLNADH